MMLFSTACWKACIGVQTTEVIGGHVTSGGHRASLCPAELTWQKTLFPKFLCALPLSKKLAPTVPSQTTLEVLLGLWLCGPEQEE